MAVLVQSPRIGLSTFEEVINRTKLAKPAWNYFVQFYPL